MSHLLVDWVVLKGILCVPLSAQFCPILPGLMGIWPKRLCSWARWWNTKFKVNPTQVHEQMGHPVQIPSFFFQAR